MKTMIVMSTLALLSLNLMSEQANALDFKGQLDSMRCTKISELVTPLIQNFVCGKEYQALHDVAIAVPLNKPAVYAAQKIALECYTAKLIPFLRDCTATSAVFQQCKSDTVADLIACSKLVQ